MYASSCQLRRSCWETVQVRHYVLDVLGVCPPPRQHPQPVSPPTQRPVLGRRLRCERQLLSFAVLVKEGRRAL
eukprot:749374-Hanusia_phi.AAC.2